jgi:hypothetical protein
VVDGHGFLVYVGLEGIIGIGERGEFERHGLWVTCSDGLVEILGLRVLVWAGPYGELL